LAGPVRPGNVGVTWVKGDHRFITTIPTPTNAADFDDVIARVERTECELIDTHVALIRMASLAPDGGFDEATTVEEHIDLVLTLQSRGESVWVEPRSIVTYLTPPRLDYGDDELGVVARALDDSVQELARRLDEQERDRARMEAGVGGMIEGVIIVDPHGRRPTW